MVVESSREEGSMELRIVNENPKYPPVKLIEPTTLGYIHLHVGAMPILYHLA